MPPCEVLDDAEALVIAPNVLPCSEIVAAVSALAPGQRLVDAKGMPIAYRCNAETDVVYGADYRAVNQLYDIFLLNSEAIVADFDRITAGRVSQPVSATNTIIG